MLPFLTVIIVLIVGASSYFLVAPRPRQPALTGKTVAKTIAVGGTQRTYLAYVPADLPADRPLLIVLHGTGQNGATIRSSTGYAFDTLADSNRFAVLYPDGLHAEWNDCRPKTGRAATVDDVGFVDALIAQAAQEYGVSRERVYLFGYSNGGQMTFRLLSEQPERFAAAAVVGANLATPEYNQCATDQPTPPLLLANGTADPIVPFAGGKVSIFGIINRGFAFSAERTAQHFAERNAAEGPIKQIVAPGVERWSWQKDARSYIERYAFVGAGHVVPQPSYRFPRLMGATPSFNLPQRVIGFFGLSS